MKTALGLIVAVGALAAASAAQRQERIVGLPCEGCEAVFDGMPATVADEGRLSGSNEPGERMIVEGVVTDASGKPAPGIVVYAYQTDAGGIYPSSPSLRGVAARHGRLRGWSKTDTSGRYRFLTVRPGGYPNTDIPQHIHMHIIEPGRCSYYIDDVVFEDDPRLTPAQRQSHDRGRGGSGVIRPTKDSAGGWVARRNIRLGAGISDYANCGR